MSEIEQVRHATVLDDETRHVARVYADALFRAAEDDWPFENVLAQLGWARTLSHEGGLFVVVGRAAGGH